MCCPNGKIHHQGMPHVSSEGKILNEKEKEDKWIKMENLLPLNVKSVGNSMGKKK